MEFFPKVKQFDKGYQWIIVELAKQMTFDDFQPLTGISWLEFMGGMLGAFDPNATPKQKQMNEGLMKTSQFYNKIMNIVKECDYAVGDILSIVNWGKIGNRPVIIDAGLTKEIYKKHYQ